MADDSVFDAADPFAFTESENLKPKFKTSTDIELDKVADALIAKQEAFRRVINTLHDLWMDLPQMGMRQMDAHIVQAFNQLMDLAPSLGVSRNGLPELRECCGKKRGLSANETDPGVVMMGTTISPFYREELGWWPGDIIRRITRFFGAAYCEKCDQRRRAINRFFGKRD